MIKEYLEWCYRKTGDRKYLTYLDVDKEEQKIRKAALWKDILDMCYKPDEGIYWFFKFILGDLMYAGYPEPVKFNKLWWEWSQLMKQGDHISIRCSRQHGKSTFWTVIQTIFRTSLFESYNVLIESASEDQAIYLLKMCIKIIENNEFLLSKKSKTAKWSTTELNYNNGIIVAKGVGSEVRGGTYDYIICDDILRSDNKLSETDIENFIGEELEAMILVRKGQLVLVGTPKSHTDIFTTIDGMIEDGSAWQAYTYPAILDWDKQKILCPERFTWSQLMNKRKIMGNLKFDKEFMCQTYSSGSQLFPNEMRRNAFEKGKEWTLYNKAKPEDSRLWTYYMGVDCARAGTAGGDYTVVFVIAYNPNTQEKRIVWVWRKKGLKISDQVDQIADISQNFNHPPILVERNNIGQDFIDVMVDNYNLHVEAFTTGSRGQGKEDLIRFLVSSFENEKMIIPNGDQFSKEMMSELDKELERFVVEITKAGNEVMKGSGHSHDDMVIALALANRCSQSYGYTPFAEAIIKTRNTTALERFAASGDVREVIRF